MKKIGLSALILIAAFVLFYSQVNLVKAASSSTRPITLPNKTPITYYKIEGRVMYRLIDALRTYKIGSGLNVTLTNLNNNKTATTTTDRFGYYTFSEPNGSYQINVSDNLGSHFFAAINPVIIKDNNVSQINFLGALKK